jgi:hypothetical protein
MARKAYDSDALPFALKHDQYMTGTRDIVYLVDRISGHVSLRDAMDFVRSEDSRTKTLGNMRDRIDYIPAKKFVIEIDTAKIFQTNTLSRKKADRVINMIWELKNDEIYKNGLMVYDLLDHNDWERPIYYAITVARDLYMNLQNYFQLEGLAYRIVPIYQPSVQGQLGSIDSDLMYDNFINKFRWGGVTDSLVYLDENNLRMLSNMRNNFGRLAETLITEGKKDSAKVVLDRCMEILPHNRVPFDFFMLPIIENYYRLGYTEKAGMLVIQLSDVIAEEERFFLLTDSRLMEGLDYEKQIRMHILQELVRLSERYGQEELKNRQLEIFEEFVHLYS